MNVIKGLPQRRAYPRGKLIFVSKDVKYVPVFSETGYTGLVRVLVQTKGSTYRNPDRKIRGPEYFKARRQARKEVACRSSG